MTVKACPECDSAKLEFIASSPQEHGGRRWRCTECYELVAEPVEREAYTSGSSSPLGAKLEKMDPDELP
jgi:transposase-like protein